MNSKEQILKILESRIDTMQTLAVESIELIYNTGYNEALEEVAKLCGSDDYYDVAAVAMVDKIRSLKK